MTYLFCSQIIMAISDENIFPLMQLGLTLFSGIAFIQEKLQSRNNEIGIQVKRGNESMGHFFGFYVAISGLLIAICLQVDFAKDHRIFWSLFDTALVAYLCLLNTWFRNKLIGWTMKLAKIEKRT